MIISEKLQQAKVMITQLDVYFIKRHKLIAIDLSKQQNIDANPKALH